MIGFAVPEYGLESISNRPQITLQFLDWVNLED